MCRWTRFSHVPFHFIKLPCVPAAFCGSLLYFLTLVFPRIVFHIRVLAAFAHKRTLTAHQCGIKRGQPNVTGHIYCIYFFSHVQLVFFSLSNTCRKNAIGPGWVPSCLLRSHWLRLCLQYYCVSLRTKNDYRWDVVVCGRFVALSPIAPVVSRVGFWVLFCMKGSSSYEVPKKCPRRNGRACGDLQSQMQNA